MCSISASFRALIPFLFIALAFSSCRKDKDDDDDDDNSGVSCEATVSDIDGNIYGVVELGGFCWMQENLRTERYNDGMQIPNLSTNFDWENTSEGAWAYYDNDPDLGLLFGKLYNWHAVNTGKLCPQGWRLPTFEEWGQLWGSVGQSANALKTVPYWNPQDGETNNSGFSAIPAGIRTANGDYAEAYNRTQFYSSYTPSIDSTRMLVMYSQNDTMYFIDELLNIGGSCRCIKGEEEDTSGFNCVGGSCSEVDSDATYATLADCQSECASTAGYNCQGGNCVAVNQNATYVSLSACISNCSGSNAGYNCNGGSCVSVSSNATYADLASCQSACAQDCNIQVAIISQTSSSATAEASGGNPPYNYIWSNGDTGPTATNLSPGSTYTVIASEVSNSECMDMIQVTIEGSSGGDCCDCTGIGFACDVCCDGEFDMIGLSWAEWEAIFADSGCDCE